MGKRGKPGKRGNGEGSIFFVEGRGWRAEVVVGRMPDGKLIRRSKTCDTKAEVTQWLDQQHEMTRRTFELATVRIDDDLLNHFQKEAVRSGADCQTLINNALRQVADGKAPRLEEMLRCVIREELRVASKQKNR